MALTIEDIITRKEGQTFDCKSGQIEPKALAVPIVAMANADGGTIAIGVSDKTRRIEGVDGNEKRHNDLLRVPFDFCNPSVRIRCEYIPCKDYEGQDNRILLMHIPASGQLHTVIENEEKVIENEEKVIENHVRVIEKVTEKANNLGDRLTENKLQILRLVLANPYITKQEMAEAVRISVKSISANITAMRGKYLNRIGPDKGGFWEVMIE